MKLNSSNQITPTPFVLLLLLISILCIYVHNAIFVLTILCLQVPRSVLEDEQGNRVSLLSPAHRQRTPEPDGLLCHVDHVQGEKRIIVIIS